MALHRFCEFIGRTSERGPFQDAERPDHREFLKKTGSEGHTVDAIRCLAASGRIRKDIVDEQIATGQKVGYPAVVIGEGRCKGVAAIDEDQA